MVESPALAVVLTTNELLSFRSIRVSSSVLGVIYIFDFLVPFSWFQNNEVEPHDAMRRGLRKGRIRPRRKGKEKGEVAK